MANFPAGPGFGSINDIGGGQGAFPSAPPPAGGMGTAMPTQGLGGSPGGLGNMVGVQLGQAPQAPSSSQPFVGATPLPVNPQANLARALMGATSPAPAAAPPPPAPAPAAAPQQPYYTPFANAPPQEYSPFALAPPQHYSPFADAPPLQYNGMFSGPIQPQAGGDAGYGGGMGF